MDERNYLMTWQKYMPVIRLHLKRSMQEEQQFKLNITDFEAAGSRGKSDAALVVDGNRNGAHRSPLGTECLCADNVRGGRLGGSWGRPPNLGHGLSRAFRSF